MESTLQLVHCARLLLEDQHRSTSQCNPTEVYVLDDAGRYWFDAIQEDPSAQTRIRWLVSRLVKEFLKDPFLGPEAIFEVVVLGPVLCQADYRDLLSCFIERFDQSALLNASLLQGVIQLLQSAPSGFLTDGDLVHVLSSLRERLESTHAPDRTHVYQLVFAVSKVLEVMVRGEVKGLNRQRDHQSLLIALRNLKGVDDDEFLKFQVSYAYQMSLYLPEDETSFQAFWRYGESVAIGASAVASVFKLDPMSALVAVEHIQQVADNAIDVVEFNTDGARAFQATAEGVTQAAENAYWSQKKQPWFLALQAGYLFVQDGRLVDFNCLVCDATCRDDDNFQRGVCQILGEIALNPLWDEGSHRSAIEFLGELCKTDGGRREDVKVRKWVATILQQISSSTSSAVSSHARTLLGDLQQAYVLDIEGCRALHTPLPIPTAFPLLERALSITDIDHELACIRFRSLEEYLHPVSIPLRAKATLLAPEDQSFPLMAKVHEFLESDKLVFLLLGDSGSGKSTFCRQLERELWNQHQRSDGGRIPLYINLPSIDDPHCSLIEKYLKHHHNILESIIQNIKDRQQFVLICDGYDESRLIQNLYTTNRLNRPGQWNVKMVITCRSTFLGREYQYWFYPIGDNIYHNNSFGLFEEATIVPFQERDIQDYILHFATQEPLDTPPIQRYQDYWRKLSAIPNLKDLVSNPFLLTLALRELPKLSNDLQDLARIKFTRLKLFDGFFKEWTRINIARLQRSNLSPEYRFVFKDLLDYGFAKCVKDFLKSLATAIHRHQNGRPVVFFSSKYNEPWKIEFFSREVKPTLLRSASPLKQAGIQHSFIHGSLLDYFDSLTLFDPFDSDDDDGNDDNDGDGDFWSGGGNSLGDGGDGLADDNDNSTGGNGESIGGGNQSTGNNDGSSGGNGGSSGGNGGSTSGNQDSSGGGGDSSGGSSGNSSGGNNDGSHGDKNGSNGDEDGSRQRKDGVRSNRNVKATKSRSSSSSDPFSERNLFKEPSVLQFLVERAESDPRLKKRLFSAIEQAKASSVPSMAAANAITILFKSGNLSQDTVLGGVLIPSDYILTATESTEPAQLSESNLTGGDLMKALVTLTMPPLAATVPTTALTVPISAPTAPASMPFSTKDRASALRLDLKKDDTTEFPGSHSLSSHLPLPIASPLLAKDQEISKPEYHLHVLRSMKTTEYRQMVYIDPMAKLSFQDTDDNLFPLMDKVRDFLAGDSQVMLILGDSAAGKSTFNRHLEHRLWLEYKTGGRIPLFVNLPSLEQPEKDLVAELLRTYDFLEDQISELKLHRQFTLICDGYDESQLTSNLHTTNLFNRPGEWDVKLLISCRTLYLRPDYRSRFSPEIIGQYIHPATNLFQEAVIAPFSKEQIKDYVKQYVPLEPRNWRTEDYMDKLTTIPDLMDLVKSPFLLSLALEALPGIVEGKQDLSTIMITRAQLYDTFVEHWSDVNKRRLQRNTLSTENRVVLDKLLDAGFIATSIDYSTRLALAIFEEQDGNPIIQYNHYKDKNTWKAQFFGQGPDVRLLRDSSPLTRTGDLYRFLHRSMLEYFFSRAIFDPSSYSDNDESILQKKPISPDDQLVDTNGPLFTRNLLAEPSVIQFLSDRVKQSEKFKQYFLSVIELSKSSAQASQAAANAITILVRAGVHFNRVDFRGIRIPGADLTGGQFDSVQLQDADLKGVNLSKAWIRQVNLSRACMDGTRFGELPYLEEQEEVLSCAFSLDDRFLAAGLSTGNVSIYDTATWKKIHVFKGHKKAVTSLVYSPNSQQLLSGSNDKTARLWDSETRSIDRILKGHKHEVRDVAFSPTGQQVATASNDKT
ncbi:Transducin (beta)-like 1 X-linked receptor 1, partial [Linnemannia elongata]